MTRDLESFKAKVWEQGKALYRDLPWRNTRDAYAILISEVMLQQTQVARVQGRWERWLEKFPTPQALAAAPLPPILQEWQGMGYNSRALRLHACAQDICERHGGEVPHVYSDLLSLPGIGPATAAGVRAFAFCEPGVYLETNVRAVFIHELFGDAEEVSDRELIPLVEECCPPAGEQVRAWYYALLDYGAHLKKTQVNPSRRSKHHSVQSKFEGSHRQKRAFLLRRVLEQPSATAQLTADLNAAERAAKRPELSEAEVASILEELAAEGFVVRANNQWFCAE